jgi:tRNA U34 5-methylaminomethyl-2-thiouridine-forming methyltransferase MnmC
MKIVRTKDFSDTLFSTTYNEHYHSTYGAKNESYHIFINAGLKQISKKNISIFEMGFGTGLNAFLTALIVSEQRLYAKYTAIEKHPVLASIYQQLNYADKSHERLFQKLHQVDWGKQQVINSHFSIQKIEKDIINYQHQCNYDLVYYDAFSPDSQPALWSIEIFERLYNSMNNNGILMTYTVKGDVKRALKAVGFQIEKLPGPKGKREILRARKMI